jgi:nitrate reductase cytochrome c-type subunit
MQGAGNESGDDQAHAFFDPCSNECQNAGDDQQPSAMGDKNRAFNGAPPTIPHPVDQMSSNSCMACHGDGVKTATLRISKMSHQFWPIALSATLKIASQVSHDWAC